MIFAMIVIYFKIMIEYLIILCFVKKGSSINKSTQIISFYIKDFFYYNLFYNIM
jgi:hypothetical protein